MGMDNLTLLRPKERAAALRTLEAVREWLAPQGLDISLSTENNDDSSLLGLYEAGSVFSKTIEVTVFTENIRKVAEELETDEVQFELISFGLVPRRDLLSQYTALNIGLTICHELGHALLEQIIDWMENIPDFDDKVGTDFIERYDSVLDDGLPEEDLVEDFAWDTASGKTHVLKACFLELSDILSKD